ncbi:21766_t:CDS:2, partial [Gigaspora margarita]
QLHEDYLKDFLELHRVFGIRERYGRQLFSEKKLAVSIQHAYKRMENVNSLESFNSSFIDSETTNGMNVELVTSET